MLLACHLLVNKMAALLLMKLRIFILLRCPVNVWMLGLVSIKFRSASFLCHPEILLHTV